MGVGSSGSPWITKDGDKLLQFSNTSLSFNSAKNIIWGPTWGEHIKEIFLMANENGYKSENINSFICKGGDIYG